MAGWRGYVEVYDGGIMAGYGKFWEHIREGHVLGEAVTGLERHDCDCWIGSEVVEEKRETC